MAKLAELLRKPEKVSVFRNSSESAVYLVMRLDPRRARAPRALVHPTHVGNDFTSRFPLAVVVAVQMLPGRSFLIDGRSHCPPMSAVLPYSQTVAFFVAPHTFYLHRELYGCAKFKASSIRCRAINSASRSLPARIGFEVKSMTGRSGTAG